MPRNNNNRAQLTTVQKMFNQRLLAAHCLTETMLENMYHNEIIPSCQQQQQTQNPDAPGEEEEEPPPSLIDTIKVCNTQLTGFGLEIVSVSIPVYKESPHVANNDDDQDQEEHKDEEENDDEDEDNKHRRSSHRRSTSTSATTTTTGSSVKYYMIVNQFPDSITKNVYQTVLFQPPTVQSYVKQVLNHLVQHYPVPISRATLLNLKNDLVMVGTASSAEDEPTTSNSAPLPKVSLANAEDMMERLIDEQWLMEVVTVVGTNTKRRNNNSNTKTTTSTKIALGPRAYGELSYLLSSSSSVTTNDDEDEPQPSTTTTTPKNAISLLPQPIFIRF